MDSGSQSTRETGSDDGGGGRRRRFSAGRALIVLVLLNIVVLAAFAIERRSRSDAEFCSGCHNMTAHVDSYLNSTHMDSAHRKASVGCKECHADYTLVDEMRSVVSFVTGDFDEVFTRHKFGDEMCNGCHVGIDYQAGRSNHLRRNPHRGHYPDLRCGACHLAHARQIDYCGRCHDNGGQRMTEDPKVVRAGAPWERMTTPGSVADERGSLDHD
jgi:nitrate/TMAO reductase-like tetraheme cytochrome c subunit